MKKFYFGIIVSFLFLASTPLLTFASVLHTDLSTPTSTGAAGGGAYDFNYSFGSKPTELFYGFYVIGAINSYGCTQLVNPSQSNDMIPDNYYLNGNTNEASPDGVFSNPGGCSYTGTMPTDQLVVFRVPTSNIVGGHDYGTNGMATGQDYANTMSASSQYFWSTPTATSSNFSGFVSAGSMYGCIATTLSDAWSCLPNSSGQPSVSLSWPPNGQQILDFQNWVINVSTTASSTSGQVFVYYGQTTTTLNYVDQAQYNIFISSNPFIIPKSVLLNPIINLYATSSWYAQVCYAGVTFSSTCSGIINFTVNPAALPSNATSAQQAQQFVSGYFQGFSSSSVSSSLIENPYSCAGTFLGISVAGCFNWALFAFAQVLFQPTQGAQSYLANSVNGFKSVQPFQSIFTVLDSASTLAASGTTNQDLAVPFAIGSVTGTIPILNSSTMSTAITPTGKTYLFNLEDLIFDLLTLGLIFFVPWHWWRQKHKQPLVK